MTLNPLDPPLLFYGINNSQPAASQPDGEFQVPSGDGMCYAPSERNVNQPAPWAAKSAVLLQNASGAFAGGANPKPTCLTSPTRLCLEHLPVFFPPYSSRVMNPILFFHCACRGCGLRSLALTSRCLLGRPAAGMQGIFSLAWSCEVIQGGRFTLKWETKNKKKMSLSNFSIKMQYKKMTAWRGQTLNCCSGFVIKNSK